jgi:hypothetical protein
VAVVFNLTCFGNFGFGDRGYVVAGGNDPVFLGLAGERQVAARAQQHGDAVEAFAVEFVVDGFWQLFFEHNQSLMQILLVGAEEPSGYFGNALGVTRRLGAREIGSLQEC